MPAALRASHSLRLPSNSSEPCSARGGRGATAPRAQAGHSSCWPTQPSQRAARPAALPAALPAAVGRPPAAVPPIHPPSTTCTCALSATSWSSFTAIMGTRRCSSRRAGSVLWGRGGGGGAEEKSRCRLEVRLGLSSRSVCCSPAAGLAQPPLQGAHGQPATRLATPVAGVALAEVGQRGAAVGGAQAAPRQLLLGRILVALAVLIDVVAGRAGRWECGTLYTAAGANPQSRAECLVHSREIRLAEIFTMAARRRPRPHPQCSTKSRRSTRDSRW